jgi:hypothetical protein
LLETEFGPAVERCGFTVSKREEGGGGGRDAGGGGEYQVYRRLFFICLFFTVPLAVVHYSMM